MSKIDTLLAMMHEGLASSLLQKIEDGEATAADLAVARQFLKDNGVTAVPSPGQNALGDLAETLPFKPGDEDPDYYN